MRAGLLAVALAPWLASCQPPDILVLAGFIGNRLAFGPAESGDGGVDRCWSEAAIVDDQARPVWAFDGYPGGDCGGLFPLFHGEAPADARTRTAATRLGPGRLYLFEGQAVASARGAFSLTRAGNEWTVRNVDPDSPAARALRQRYRDRAASAR